MRCATLTELSHRSICRSNSLRVEWQFSVSCYNMIHVRLLTESCPLLNSSVVVAHETEKIRTQKCQNGQKKRERNNIISRHFSGDDSGRQQMEITFDV